MKSIIVIFLFIIGGCIQAENTGSIPNVREHLLKYAGKFKGAIQLHELLAYDDALIFTVWYDRCGDGKDVYICAHYQSPTRNGWFLDKYIENVSWVKPKVIEKEGILLYYTENNKEVYRHSMKNLQFLTEK
jgi:hypothetical protein